MKRTSAIVTLAACLLATPAFAAIEVKSPLTKVVKQVGQLIYAGNVTSIAADNAGFTLGDIEAFKGEPGAAIEVTASDEIVKRLAKGSPVVVYSGLGQTIVHMADEWFLAKSAKGTLKITGKHATGATDTFPGRTPALIEATRELVKDGKTSMIDSLGAMRPLNGDERVIQKLAGIKDPTSFVAADINNDGLADFFVCSAGSVRLFVSDGASYVHATEKFGLENVKGKKIEFTTDAPLGIIVDDVDYQLSSGKFVKTTVDKSSQLHAKQPGGNIATGNFGDTKEVYKIEVKKDGVTRTTLAAKDPADGVRLTGGKITEYHTEQREKGFENFQCTAIDANGDGKDDLFIRADNGNLLLINRGFGAFLVDRDSGIKLKTTGLLSSGKLDAKSKNESLLVLAPDGTVSAIDTKDHAENH